MFLILVIVSYMYMRAKYILLRTHGFTTGFIAVESGMSVSPRAGLVISGDKLTRDSEDDENYSKEFVEAPRT